MDVLRTLVLPELAFQDGEGDRKENEQGQTTDLEVASKARSPSARAEKKVF